MLLLTPVLSLSGAGEVFTELYHGYEYEQYRRELEEQEEYFQDLDLLDFLPEEYFVTESGAAAAETGEQERENAPGEHADAGGDQDLEGIRVDEIEVKEVRIGEEVE